MEALDWPSGAPPAAIASLAQRVVLEAGDVLVIPAMYLHHVCARADGGSASLSLWTEPLGMQAMHTALRTPLPAAVDGLPAAATLFAAVCSRLSVVVADVAAVVAARFAAAFDYTAVQPPGGLAAACKGDASGAPDAAYVRAVVGALEGLPQLQLQSRLPDLLESIVRRTLAFDDDLLPWVVRSCLS